MGGGAAAAAAAAAAAEIGAVRHRVTSCLHITCTLTLGHHLSGSLKAVHLGRLGCQLTVHN